MLAVARPFHVRAILLDMKVDGDNISVDARPYTRPSPTENYWGSNARESVWTSIPLPLQIGARMKPLTPEHVEMLKEICELADSVNKPPAFQFYVQDWLGSSTILSMTPAQEGAYIRLLACCWDNPKLSIPNDPIRLSMLSRLNHEWQDLGPTIIDSFFREHPILGTKFLTNVRLIEVRHHQLLKQIEAKESRSRRGKPTKLTTNEGTDVPTDVVTDVPTLPGFRASGLPSSLTPKLSDSQEDVSATVGIELANLTFDLVLKNHPNLPTFKKDKKQTLKSWSKTIEKFLKRTGKQAEELERFFKWLAQDRQEKRPGSDWVGWSQPFQSVSVLEKDSAWAAFGRSSIPDKPKGIDYDREERYTEMMLAGRGR